MKSSLSLKLTALALAVSALFSIHAQAALSGDIVEDTYATIVGETSTGSITVDNGENYTSSKGLFLGNSYSSPAGNAGYETFNMSGGSASLNSLYLGGGAQGVGVLTLSAGTLTGGVINVAYSGNASGHIEMTGGTMSVSGLYLGGGSTETASMNLLGGSFYSDSYVQIGTASAQGHMVISSKADVGLGGIWIGRSGKLTLVLDGGDGDFTRAVVDVTAGNNDNRYWASTGAQGEIDLSKYTATAEQTITLIHTAGIVQGSVDISWVISGLDEGKYSVGEGAYWNGSDLMLTISLVPEPAYAAGLLGFAALLLAARRRK